jgi:hypothetical protein
MVTTLGDWAIRSEFLRIFNCDNKSMVDTFNDYVGVGVNGIITNPDDTLKV